MMKSGADTIMANIESVMLKFHNDCRDDNFDSQEIINELIPFINNLHNIMSEVINGTNSAKTYRWKYNRLYEIDKNNGPSAIVDPDRCFITGSSGYGIYNYKYGNLAFIDDYLLSPLRKNRDYYERNANSGGLWYLWYFFAFPYYRARQSTYLENYDSMIITVSTLKTEIESNYNDIKIAFDELTRAKNEINKVNPNLITFATRYFAFVEKCGNTDNQNNKQPFIQTMSLDDIKEFKEFLRNWYSTK